MKSTKHVYKPTRYVIDGLRYDSIAHVYSVAKTKGFDGCITTIGTRLHAGENTWVKLCRPPLQHQRERGEGQRKNLAKKRDEMSVLIAGYENRKMEQLLSIIQNRL